MSDVEYSLDKIIAVDAALGIFSLKSLDHRRAPWVTVKLFPQMPSRWRQRRLVN